MKILFRVQSRHSTYSFNNQHEFSALTIFRDDEIRVEILDYNRKPLQKIAIPNQSDNSTFLDQLMDVIKNTTNPNYSFKIFLIEKGPFRIRFESKLNLINPKDLYEKADSLFHYEAPPLALKIFKELLDKRNLFDAMAFVYKYNDGIVLDDEASANDEMVEVLYDQFAKQRDSRYEKLKLKRDFILMIKSSKDTEENVDPSYIG